MKLSVNWLKNYVAIKVQPAALAHKLTMAGLEVKGIDSVGDDAVFEIEITPNRPDCLSVIGIAREASAILNKSLKLPAVKKLKIPKQKCNLTIVDKKDCARYIGCLIRNVMVHESPSCLKKLLNNVGLRTINNVVDITNFCLLETGQPLHAFDFDKLAGGKIIVRRAKEGETLVTIDGVERKLNSSILVIADDKRVVALAGIMGGKDTEVTERTKNVLLESAYFDPILIRRGARSLGLSTDASYRFERGVDMNTVEKGARRAIALIVEEAKGSVGAYFDLYSQKRKITNRQAAVSQGQIEDFLGATLPLKRCRAILNKLEFKTAVQKNILKAAIPPFRNDVSRDVDILEEIARIVGYDNLPVSLTEVKFSNVAVNGNRILRQNLSDALLSLGLNEAINYAMTSRKALEASMLSPSEAVKVQNPLSAEQEILRFSMLPGLLQSVSVNLNRGQKDLRFFEIGKRYFAQGEKETLAIILTGRLSADWRKPSRDEADFYDLKGIIEIALEKIGIDIKHLQFAPNQETVFEAGRAANILLSGKAVGAAGVVSTDILGRWDIKQKTVLFAEIDLETVYAKAKPKDRVQPIPAFPAVVRDLSLAVKNEITFQDISDVIHKTGGEFLASVKLLEQYLGEKIQAGHRGLVLSLTYQSPLKTLKEGEVSEAHEKICKALIDTFGVLRR